jgi:hypothetical protein
MKRQRKPAAPTADPARGAVSTSAQRQSRRYHLAAVLALVLATLAAFSNSFSTGFALDNQTLILQDTRIQSLSIKNAGRIFRHTYWWPSGESGLYRPLTTLSYLLNYTILGNGDHPAGYHWINVFLHLGNVLLVFALVLHLIRGRAHALRTAFFAALLWAVHPVLTESVTNIVGRADLLAGFGVLSGFLCYLKSVETTGRRRGAWLMGLAATTTVGVFSKESAVVLPAVLVLYELSFEKRWKVLSRALIATLVPIGAMLGLRAAVLSAALPTETPFLDNPIVGAGFWTGRLTALEILARYLWLTVWPIKLSADYSYLQIPLARGSVEDWMSWLAVTVAVALTILLWRHSRLSFFFVGFASLALLPTANLLFPIGAMMAERFLYLPLVGLMAAVVLGMDAASERLGSSGVVLTVCVIGAAAGFGIRTWRRNVDWTDDKTMATAGVQTSPGSFKFHRLLASQLLLNDPSHRQIDRAVAEANRSVAILAPVPDELDSPGPWNLAAVCHRVKGDSLPPEQAAPQYEEAARLALRSIAIDRAYRAAYARRYGIKSEVPATAAEGYRTLASAYLHLMRGPEALAAAKEAQAIDPANVGAYEEMADAEVAQRRPDEAAIALAEGVLATGNPNLLQELVFLYRSGGDPKGCAIIPGPHGPTLNLSCPTVHQNLCEAGTRIHREDLRQRLRCGE